MKIKEIKERWKGEKALEDWSGQASKDIEFLIAKVERLQEILQNNQKLIGMLSDEKAELEKPLNQKNKGIEDAIDEIYEYLAVISIESCEQLQKNEEIQKELSQTKGYRVTETCMREAQRDELRIVHNQLDNLRAVVRVGEEVDFEIIYELCMARNQFAYNEKNEETVKQLKNLQQAIAKAKENDENV